MGQIAFGTLLKMGDGGGPETFTTVAEVTDIGGPDMSMETVDITNHSSPGAWKEKAAGLLDAGKVPFTINFIPTGATHGNSAGLVYAFKNRLKKNWQLVFPDGSSTTWAFPAFITKLSPKEPIDDKLSADIELEITGAPTLA